MLPPLKAIFKMPVEAKSQLHELSVWIGSLIFIFIALNLIFFKMKKAARLNLNPIFFFSSQSEEFFSSESFFRFEVHLSVPSNCKLMGPDGGPVVWTFAYEVGGCGFSPSYHQIPSIKNLLLEYLVIGYSENIYRAMRSMVTHG